MSGAPRRRPVPDELFGGRLKGCYFLDLEIAAIVDRSPQVRAITFRSPDLLGFEWKPGQDLMLEVPGMDSVRRRYTIRRSDPREGTVDIEVVLHGDGPFSRWAANATVGDHIEGIGPRGVITVRPDARHHLFVADQSAVPATFAMLEALPAGTFATAVLVADKDLVASEPSEFAADVTIDVVGPGEVTEHLRTVTIGDGTVAYVNGERSLVRDAVDMLTARGLSSDAIASKAYWRRDQANAPHGEPARD